MDGAPAALHARIVQGQGLKEELVELSRGLGFARVGVAQATALELEGERLSRWVAEGRHGTMQWMADTSAVRRDPGHQGMVPGACSVLVLASPYARADAEVGPAPAVVARYARGRDYHNVLRKRVRKLERFLRERGHEARASVDSRPVFERAWAQRAGLGFIGKNCCLIVPGVGSHLFLACVVTTADLPPDAPMKQRCGECRLCLDACPTQAFVGARELDARRCVSYLTIEHEGPIDEALRPGLGRWMLGCDACQDTCPFNQTSLPAQEVTAPYAPHERWQSVDTPGLLSIGEAEFDAWSEGSPMRRLGRAKAARNAAYVLGNTGERRYLPVLRQASTDEDEAVRDAVAWAIARLEAEPEL